MADDQRCATCGHTLATHRVHGGYRGYGRCCYQHDLCGCNEYVAAPAPPPARAPLPHLRIYSQRDAEQLREDFELCGAAFVDAQGRRIDPLRVTYADLRTDSGQGQRG